MRFDTILPAGLVLLLQGGVNGVSLRYSTSESLSSATNGNSTKEECMDILKSAIASTPNSGNYPEYAGKILQKVYLQSQKQGISCFSGSNHQDPTAYVADSYPVNNMNNQKDFPEQALNLANLDVAVCFSGGGNRAYSLFEGQMRAFTEANLIKKFGYLSTVSGSSWGSTIYTFYDGSEDILGASQTPSSMSMDNLNQTPDGMGRMATRSLVLLAIEILLKGETNFDELWSNSVGKTYLEDFNLNDDKYITFSNSTADTIIQNNPSLSRDDFYMAQSDRPYLVLNSVLLAPNNHKSEETVSFQISPFAAGSPYFPNEAKVSYQDMIGPLKASKWVGGGFIDTFALGGKHNSNGTVSSTSRFTLAYAAGASSNAPGFALQQNILTQQLNPKHNYFPTAGETNIKTKNNEFRFGDGGNIDDIGLIAMLQRGVKKVVVFDNSDIPLVNTSVYDGCTASGPPTEDQWASESISPLFGETLTTIDGYFNNNHIFDGKDMPELICALQTAAAKGEAASYRQNLTTLENTFWGIPAGQEVEIFWYYLNEATNFNEELPADTQAELAKGTNGSFPDFPNLPTFGLNPGTFIKYENNQVNILTGFGQWMVDSTISELVDFLA